MASLRITIAVFTISLCSMGVAQSDAPAEYSRARIHYGSMENLILLGAQGLEVDHGKHKQGVYIESDFSKGELEIAKSMGLQVDILIDDVQQFYVERNNDPEAGQGTPKNATCSSAIDYAIPTNFNHGSMGGYLTYTEALAEIDDMFAQYPNLISAKQPIGTFLTIEGRPLHWVRLSDNPNMDEAEPEMLYSAIHHAREPCSMQQMIFYMWYLLENYATDPEVQAIVDNAELYFVPFVNPDGYVYNETTNPNGGGLWRKNRRDHGNGDFGVDNNRNYDYTDPTVGQTWGTAGISFNTGDQTYCGTGPFSEVENQAMAWFVDQREFTQAFNNHTYSNLLLYPFGFDLNMTTVDDPIFRAHSELMVSQNGYSNILSSLLYPASGDSDDWMYGETQNHAKVFAYTPEIGSEFWPPAAQIDDLCKEMMYMNLIAAHLILNYAEADDASPYVIPSTSGFFNYDLQRLGFDGPGDFSVSIDPVSANIMSVGTANSHNGMAMLQHDQDSISFALDPTIMSGDLVTYDLVVDQGWTTTRYTIDKVYGQAMTAFFEPADNVNGWTTTGSWSTTTSTFYSAPSSITDSPNGNYSNGSNTRITLTNAVDLSNTIGAVLSFQCKWDIEAGYDYTQVLVSDDNGATWIPQCGNYTITGGPDHFQADGEPLYDGIQTDWVLEEIDLSDYLGQSILIRFQLRSDGGVNEDGFYFDDLAVSIIPTGPSSVSDLQDDAVGVSQNMPNPVNHHTTINYALEAGTTSALLNVMDAAGKLVHSMAINPSRNTVELSASHLSPGVYTYHILTEQGRSTSKRMTVVR